LTQERHQLFFGHIVEQFLSPQFLFELGSRDSRDESPGDTAAEDPPQGSESIVGVGFRQWKECTSVD
jgi:hypothetical protein